MGDLESLIQLANEEIDDADSMQKVTEAMMSGKFTLNDMYYQMSQVKKMGPLQKVMSLLPGFSGIEDKIDYEASQKKLQIFRTIMDSMTNEEREDPSLIKSKRIERIANGAGVSPHDVKELLAQYNMTKKSMSQFGKDRKARKNMMKQLNGVNLEALKNMQQ
jgi:signal recognition particle subunit SRP54